MANEKDELMERIRVLQGHRLAVALSDDYAYTNGSIDRIDREIAEVRDELAKLTQ